MRKVDFKLLIPSLILSFFGLSIFYSIDQTLFFQQFFSLCVSLMFFFVFMFIPWETHDYYSKVYYFLCILLLVIVILVGFEVKGSVRWIEIFGVSIQFSEILKPFFILCASSFFCMRIKKNFFSYILGLTLFSPIFFLILRQPDLGSASIYLLAILPLFILSGYSIFYFVIFCIFLIIPLPIIYSLLHDYQQQRIYTFFNISSDPLGNSYNAVQSVISVGSGGVFGKGLGHATQSILRFLPERHTDFVFATFSETFGFVGTLTLISLYIFLFYRIYQIATLSTSAYIKIASFGFFFLFLIHVFFNIGMNIAILPIVGVTLPFVSYGGSSLVANFIVLGILNSFVIQNLARGREF